MIWLQQVLGPRLETDLLAWPIFQAVFLSLEVREANGLEGLTHAAVSNLAQRAADQYGD